MKKLFSIIIISAILFTFTACNAVNESGDPENAASPSVSADVGDSSSAAAIDPVQTEKFTVTFIQEGQEVKTETVEKGGAVTSLPTLAQTDGYVYIWSMQLSELSDIRANVVVTAIKTAKTFTVNYSSGYEKEITETTEVTYGQPYSLIIPETRETHSFVCWEYDGKAVSGEVWNIDDGEEQITLTAKWEDKLSVSFIQDGQETKTYYVENGSHFTDIPKPVAIDGYDVSWDLSSVVLENITAPIKVYAVFVPKTFYVTYQIAEGVAFDDSLVLTDEGKLAVVFGEAYNLGTATKRGYTFVGFTKTDGTALETVGDRWDYVEDLTVVAVFTPNTYVVRFVLNGGKFSDGDFNEIIVTFGQEYDLGEPTKEKYNFMGWYFGSEPFSRQGVWGLTENITVTATWKKAERWSILV